MKIGLKLILGFLAVALLVAVFGFYVIFQQNQISKISHEVEEASDISLLAFAFNVENFHTQLEIWEYAFDPNPTRLAAFNEHNERLSELLEELVEEVGEEEEDRSEDKEITALHEGGLEDVKEIESSLKLVREDWVSFLDKIQKVRDLTDAGYNDVKSENHNKYMAAFREVNEAAVTNEDLFDKLKFNAKVAEFVEHQSKLQHDLEEKQVELIARFKTILYTLVVGVVILSLLFAFFFSRSISKPIRELTKASEEFKKGNLDYKIDITSKDEIGELSETFDNMRLKIKNDYQRLNLTLIQNLKKKINELKETKQKASFVSKNPAPVLQFNYNGRIISANPAAQKMFDNVSVGKFIFSILPNLSKSTIEKISEKGTTHIEQRIKDKIFLFTLIKDLEIKSIYIYGSDVTKKVGKRR